MQHIVIKNKLDVFNCKHSILVKKVEKNEFFKIYQKKGEER